MNTREPFITGNDERGYNISRWLESISQTILSIGIGMFLMLTLLAMSNWLVPRNDFHCEIESKFYGCKVFVSNDVTKQELQMLFTEPEQR